MDIKRHIANRLESARTEAGIGISDVAEYLGMVRQTYSKFEQGLSIPDAIQIIKLCTLYDKPLGYFYEHDDSRFRFAMRADSPDHLDAKLQNSLVEKLKNISAIEEAASANQLEDLPNSMPLFSATDADLSIVEDKALSERSRLGIGSATCVGDIVSILESADIRIIPFEKKPAEDNKFISGFSAFSDKYGTAIYVNAHESISIERQIFSICHEYAHLIFHRDEYDGPGKKYKTSGRSVSPEEKIANHFAGSFLVPPSALRKQFMLLGGAWAYEETIMRLKGVFKVSATCIIERLSKNKLITAKNSQILWAIANKKGWKIAEPNPIQESLGYDRRLLVLSRKAWEEGSASESFIGDLLGLDRKKLSELINEWYCEQEDEHNAF